MKNQMHVMTIMKVRGLDLNYVRRVTEQQLMVVQPSFSGSSIEQLFQLMAWQYFEGETSIVCSLQSQYQLLQIELQL